MLGHNLLPLVFIFFPPVLKTDIMVGSHQLSCDFENRSYLMRMVCL